ncbi:MAG TPA: hypothetical protein VK709_19075 [Candidatus Saccharimonadales bacterium]|jgi:hypothetical protein|nr:hypothetical protein [Candidatus Saccharimonadales bacterium]
MLYQDKIREAFERHRISAEIICRIVPGLNPTGLSRFMNHNVTLPALPELMQTLSDLDALAADAKPYGLPFDNPAELRKTIERFRSGLRFVPIPIGPKEEIADFEAETTETKQ